MGIQIIDNGNEAALFDSTTMWAFGPVFESEFDATNFMRWVADRKGIQDVRRIGEVQLKQLHEEWQQVDWANYDPEDKDNHAPFFQTC